MTQRIIVLTVVAAFANASAKRMGEAEVLAANDSGSDSAKGVPNGLPPFLVDTIQGMTNQECVFKLAADYTKDLSEEDKQKIWNEAWEEAGPAIVHRHRFRFDPLGASPPVVTEDMGIPENFFPLCKSGMIFKDCGASLPPAMWLLMRLHNKDILKAHKTGWAPWATKRADADWKVHDGPLVKAREHLWDLAVKKTGFSNTRAQAYCESEEDNPDREELRECILDQVDNATVKSRLKHIWQLDDELLSMKTLSRRKEQKKTKDQSRQLQTLISEFKKQIDPSLVKGSLRYVPRDVLGLAFVDKVRSKFHKFFRSGTTVKACKRIASPAEKMRILQARAKELSTVCNSDQGCIEGSSYCPTGFACDCQKQYTPQRAKLAAAVMFCGGAKLSRFLIGTAVAGPAAGAAFVIAGSPSTPAVAALSYFLFSRSFFPKCMCYPLKAKLESGQCQLELGSKKMKNSSNPLSWLPADGFKVIPAGSSKSTCEIVPCDAYDVAHKNAQSFFGKVGRLLGDPGLYNCAATEGTLETSLGRLHKLPMPALKKGDPSPGFMANTAESRNELLSAFFATSGPSEGTWVS